MAGRTDSRWSYRLGILSAAVFGTLLMLGLVVVSPVAMRAIVSGEPTWGALSEVGQAYGAISAVLSALAFCGIAVSLFLQWRQSKISQMIVMRERQFDLIQLSLTDPKLIYFRVHGGREEDRPMMAYANLWMSHWKLLWDLRQMQESELRHLAHELFDHEVAYMWWEKVGPHWNQRQDRRTRSFVRIVNAAHQNIGQFSSLVRSTAAEGPAGARVPRQREASSGAHAGDPS